jgi:hypothetical protein
MWGRGDTGAGHAREALAAWLKIRDKGLLGDCFVAAVDCIDVQGMILETLDARSWRRRSRSTRACRQSTCQVLNSQCFDEEWGCGEGGMQGRGMRVKLLRRG